MANISDDFSRNLQAEVETNFAIQRSQRLTFQKGTTVVDSQQLRIDNIDTVKVDIMPPPAAAVHSNSHRKVLEMTRQKTGGKNEILSNEACGYRVDCGE
nr:GATA transcription factor 1-like [Ipomoea batatas]